MRTMKLRVESSFRRSAVVGVAVAALAAALSAAPLHAASAATWDGNVSPIIRDATARVTALPDKRINRWFDQKATADPDVARAALNAMPTGAHPKVARNLGNIQVIYGVAWPGEKSAPAVSLVLKYNKGVFTGYKKVSSPFIGSFGFAQPRYDMVRAIDRANWWVTDHPGKVPPSYRLDGAQLQKADAPPPTFKELRWVVTYADGPSIRQVLVYMNGRVEFGGRG